MDVEIKIVAYSFPTVALVLGFLLILAGASSGDRNLDNLGVGLIALGVVTYIITILISIIKD